MILDVAVTTSVDLQDRVGDDDPYKPLEDRYKQKLSKYQQLANQDGLQLIPAAFSHTHTGRIHDVVKRFIKDQIRLMLTFTEGEVKCSLVVKVYLFDYF